MWKMKWAAQTPAEIGIELLRKGQRDVILLSQHGHCAGPLQQPLGESVMIVH